MKKLLLLCSTAAFCMPAAAFAQSTGSVDFEKDTIIVTGTRTKDVGGVQVPDTTKAKAVLTQEVIARSNPGQTILDTVNLVPGVSFQNNDAYGSSGGTLNIRGFDASRISLTFDGIQLNDSGNYAIFSGQQLDPELIEQVNVNLGSTDVDSPTASAVGGTVNYRTILPQKEMGVRALVSIGEFDFHRFFGVFHTGEIGPWGTRAFIAASSAKNDNPFNNYGKVNKQQYNGRIYQPLGANGDFLSLAGNYNENRNHFFGSLPLRTDLTQSATDPRPRNVGPLSTQRYPRNGDEREYDINYPCNTDTPQTGVVDTTSAPTLDLGSCGTEFDRRYNPSNTGNIRGASRFTLAEGVVLTVDPSYQYVKANGGGTVIGREGVRTIGGVNYTGFIGGQYYFGRDLNGDGDIIDTCSATGASCSSTNFAGVTLLAPSQTHTDRYGLIAGLRWDINPDNTVRVSYTLDDAHHRQTGELGFLGRDGEPDDVFPINDPISDVNGTHVQKRDRKSLARLNQVSGEYRGEFFDDHLTVNLGIRAPFFIRKLNNYCFTTSASGFVDCFGQDAVLEAAYALANPTFQGPQKRTFKYDKLLPNLGVVYDFTGQISAFVNYSKGLSVPSTDNLYNSFFFAPDTDEASPKPETTDSFDGGLRYRSSKIQAQASVWYTKFHNRTASAFDPELNQSVFRSLGDVNKWGIDGSIAYNPFRQLTVYAFGSWNDSKIKENVQTGALPVGVTCDSVDPSSVNGLRNCAFTKGNRESGTPKYTYGFSALGSLGPFDLGVTAKRTGPRTIFDNGAVMFRGDIGVTTTTPGRIVQEQIFGATAPAYWLVNLDARYNLAHLSPQLNKTYFQLNVYNLLDKFYVGGFSGGLSQATSTRTCNATSTPSCVPTVTVPTWGAPPFVQIGAPRTISGTLNIGF
ncbi:MAG TPA: TonB-dependent receptor [Sphingomicrobium sp.]|nr:TonB-dependent receptor [Sphingomicrobium sp.]